MTSRVSAVACMRLLGGVQVPPKPARGVIRHPLFALTDALRPFVIPPPNARHHPPAGPVEIDDRDRDVTAMETHLRPQHTLVPSIEVEQVSGRKASGAVPIL